MPDIECYRTGGRYGACELIDPANLALLASLQKSFR